jgi:hypothetical protein
MAHVVDYVRSEGMLYFTEKPLNDVDGVILAQLAYMDFDFLYEKAIHSLSDFTSDALIRRAMHNTWDAAGNISLLRALIRSPRFRNISWHGYKNLLRPTEEQQFTAITLDLGNGVYYLAYRGTSSSLIDWKEDLNMTFLQAVPSQTSARDYFERISRIYPGRYYLGGHSKGGNLAVYAAVNAPQRLQQKIIGVYSVDGPGIKQDIPDAIADRVHKLIPESSVIGLLLEPGKNYTVVASEANGIDQHSPHTWILENNAFLEVGAISSFSKFTEKSVSKWLESVDDATKQEFLNSLFGVFAAARFTRLPEVTGDIPATMRIIGRQVRGMRPEDQQQWRTVTDAFVSSVVSEAQEVISRRRENLASEVGGALSKTLETVKSAVPIVRSMIQTGDNSVDTESPKVL